MPVCCRFRRHAGPIADRAKRWLGTTVRIGEAETPAVDRLPADPPIIGPAEHVGTRGVDLVDEPQLPVERRSLRLLSVHVAGEADLGEDERLRAGDDLQVGQVAVQCLGILEEHVEGDHVEVVDPEELHRRVVRVRREHVVVGGVHVGHELERMSSTAAMPCTRTRSPGISLPTDMASTSGAPSPQARNDPYVTPRTT